MAVCTVFPLFERVVAWSEMMIQMSPKPSLTRLVVIIPGIGGTILREPNGLRRRVWGHQRATLVAAGLDSDRLSLGNHPELEPDGLVRDVQPVPGWTVVAGYHHIGKAIFNAFGDVVLDGGSVPGNVMEFGYDFRKSVVHAATELDKAIGERLRSFPSGTRVVLVGHSLGGLVARYWIGRCGGSKICDGLITLGTPHRGAPKALNVLANGIRVSRLKLDTLSRVVADWDSLYELLPDYSMIWDPVAATYVLPDALGNLAVRARKAARIHQEINDWCGISPLPTWAYFGSGNATFRTARLEGDIVQMDLSLQPSGATRPLFEEPDLWVGDGTVPSEAGTPIELETKSNEKYPVAHRHAMLPRDASEHVVDALRKIHGIRSTPLRGDGEDPMNPRPHISLGMDDFYLRSSTIEIVAQHRDTGELEVIGTNVDILDESARCQPVQLNVSSNGTTVAHFDAPVSGVFEVCVASTLSDGSSIEARDLFCVVDE